MLYLVAQIAPHAAFVHVTEEGRFTLQSDRPISTTERTAMLEASKRILASGLDDPAMRHDVFLCHDAARFAFFAPFNRRGLGITNSFGVSFVRAGTKRSLASLIAHERTHAMLAHRYGVLARAWMEEWKLEGICEYVAGDISFDIKLGKSLLRAGQSDASNAFRYFTYWLAVRHMVEVKGLTLQQVIASKQSEAEAIRAAVEALDDD